MQSFAETLNEMLVAVYNKILHVEESFLRKGVGAGLTIREMHMIEFIGKAGKEGRTLSETADYMEVARPSVTVAVKKLEAGGLLLKTCCAQDGRAIRVTLTREGRKIFMHHMRFHMLMVHELEEAFDEDEKRVMMNAIEKLDSFFDRSLRNKP